MIYITSEKCGRCGESLTFSHTSNKGTRVAFHWKHGTSISRNVKMPFLWVYFKCSKCGWILCTTNRSKNVEKLDKTGERKYMMPFSLFRAINKLLEKTIKYQLVANEPIEYFKVLMAKEVVREIKAREAFERECEK